MAKKKSWTYARAGVNITAGDALVDFIKKKAPGIGGFAGEFPLQVKGKNTVSLVGCTDGVGTKLKLAQEMGIHHTIGIDLVAMNVNDLICAGARPLFFLDYFAAGRLELPVAKKVLQGIFEGCRQGQCVLLGGETAEMPGMYPDGEYDLAGFAVGVLDNPKNRLPRGVKNGDVILGLPSTGFHSNGYSLVRRLFSKTDYKRWGERLLSPTRIYVQSVLGALNQFPGAIKALAHITGGGLLENVPRVLPKNRDAAFYVASWPVPEVFVELQSRGKVAEREMFRTFNMGLGMVIVADPHYADALQNFLRPCFRVGRVQEGSQKVLLQ